MNAPHAVRPRIQVKTLSSSVEGLAKAFTERLELRGRQCSRFFSLLSAGSHLVSSFLRPQLRTTPAGFWRNTDVSRTERYDAATAYSNPWAELMRREPLREGDGFRLKLSTIVDVQRCLSREEY